MARYRTGIRTEERILRSTRELLSELGLEAATLKAICDRAGVKAGSFYNLFSSKEEAVLRVLTEAIAAADSGFTHSDNETPHDLIEAYARFIVNEPTLARIYVQLAASGGLSDSDIGHRFLRHHQRRVSRFSAAIKRSDATLDDAEREAHAELTLATLNGLAFRWMLEPDFDFDSHIQRLLSAPDTVAT